MANLLKFVFVFSILSCTVCCSTSCSTFRGPGELETAEFEHPGEYQGQGLGQHEYPKGETDKVAFDWPVDDARLTQQFDTSKKRPHWGVDLASSKGTSILASEKGYVIYTGKGFRGYGNLIVVEHSPEWATLYSHLQKILVKEGQFVQQGEKIGTMGRTGRASGVHLHFEIRHNRQPVNPQAYLPMGM